VSAVWWQTNLNGSVWHAYTDDAPLDWIDQRRKRRMICGRWRQPNGRFVVRNRSEPEGPICQDCDAMVEAPARTFPVRATGS
jgi:hypothetical protein